MFLQKFIESYPLKTKVLGAATICSLLASGVGLYLAVRKQNEGSGRSNNARTADHGFTVRTEEAVSESVSPAPTRASVEDGQGVKLRQQEDLEEEQKENKPNNITQNQMKATKIVAVSDGVEAMPSVSRKVENEIVLEEAPPRLVSRKGDDKIVVEEAPPSLVPRKGENEIVVEEAPPSLVSRKGESKIVDEEAPPSLVSWKVGNEIVVDEAPPSLVSRKGESKIVDEEAPPSLVSWKVGNEIVNEAPPSLVSIEEGEENEDFSLKNEMDENMLLVRPLVRGSSLLTDADIMWRITESNNSRNIIFTAIKTGDVQVVEAVLKLGAPLDIQDRKGMFPIHKAAAKGFIEVLELLLHWGADINAKDLTGYTALHRAALKGKTDMVKWLIDKGLSITETNWAGWTPLHLAAQGGYLDMVMLLVDSGADIHALDKDGWTPLYLADLFKKSEVSEYLMSIDAK